MPFRDQERARADFAAGRLPPEEAQLLAAAMENDPDLRRDVVEDLRLAAQLRQFGASDEAFVRSLRVSLEARQEGRQMAVSVRRRMALRRPPVVPSPTAWPRAVPWGRRWFVLAAAASLLALLGGWWGAAGRQWLRVDGVRGECALLSGSGRRPLAASDRIRAGATVVAGTQGGVTLTCRHEATTLRLEADTVLQIVSNGRSGLHARLTQGRLHASVAKQKRGRSLVIDTQDSHVRVVGTEFDLGASDFGTRLDVTEGVVEIQGAQANAASSVGAGGFAVVERGKPVVAINPPREGLLALYRFTEGSGRTVHDVASNGIPMDLTIARTGLVRWCADRVMLVGDAGISSGPASKVAQALQASSNLSLVIWCRASEQCTTNVQYGLLQLASAGGTRAQFCLHYGDKATLARVNRHAIALTREMTPAGAKVCARHAINGEEEANGVLPMDPLAGGAFSLCFPFAQPSGRPDRSAVAPWTGDIFALAIYDRLSGGQE
jgi:hypothetical protein